MTTVQVASDGLNAMMKNNELKTIPREADSKKSETVHQADSMIMAAEHANTIADDLGDWADASESVKDALSRWRAVAEVRRMACARWGEASRQLRSLY